MPKPGRLPQFAVIWQFTSNDYQGNPLFDVPYEIPARWEDTKTTEIVDGKVLKVKAFIIYSHQRIKEASRIWQGCLKNLPEDLNPATEALVLSCETIPNIKGRNKEYCTTASVGGRQTQ